MPVLRRVLACLFVALLHTVGGPCWSQNSADEPLSAPRPRIRVPRVPRAPELDDFLTMKPAPDLEGGLKKIEGFIQRDPEDGKSASQTTHVYVGYDSQFFYCIFVAFDAEPDRIRAHLTRREQVFGDETVEVQLDTFHDERRAFSFLANPFGIQWDAIWTEGQGFDDSWDTVWQSNGKLTEEGYVVWMAIPFKSLRFKPRPEQTWGLVFVRDIPRNNEVSFWPRVSNRIEGRLNQAATLDGLEGISPGRNIWLIPYATAHRFRAVGDSGSTGVVKVLWDSENLYLYAVVTDKLLSKSAENAYEQDSFEIFIDQNNAKTSTYQADDGQYRINFDNEATFNGGASAELLTSATKITDDGYIVELAIKFDHIEPQEGMLIGFDVQVNNDEDGNGIRDSVVTWNDSTHQGYQNTSSLGVLLFVK